MQIYIKIFQIRGNLINLITKKLILYLNEQLKF